MNARLNALSEKEIGREDGRELPAVEAISWVPTTSGERVILD